LIWSVLEHCTERISAVICEHALYWQASDLKQALN
jgi:hypothetical protein